MSNLTKQQAQALTDEYAVLKHQIEALQKKQASIKTTLIAYMKQHKLSEISTNTFRVKLSERAGNVIADTSKLKNEYQEVWEAVKKQGAPYSIITVKRLD